MQQHFISDWSAFPELPANSGELIIAEATSRRADLRTSNFGDVDESDRLTHYRSARQQFAVFGAYAYAYELHSMISDEDERRVAMRPALVGGKYYQSNPDEGASTILYWVWTNRANMPAWTLCWLANTGWIRTSELEQSPEEIATNIFEEIEDGETPLTGLSSRPEYQ